MTYRITVTQNKENPNYEEELKEYRKYSTFNRPFEAPRPQKLVEVKTMEVELTELQFEAMKKSIIATF
jgi:hypothetical protein